VKLIFLVAVLVAAAVAAAQDAEKPVAMKDLPPVVQKAIQAETKGATVKGLSQEVDGGKTYYEAETAVNGHGRDLLFDASGALVEVEEEVKLETLPPAARAAIEKSAKGGKLEKLEKLTKGKAISYEAAIAKAGKTTEVRVNPDGSPAKE